MELINNFITGSRLFQIHKDIVCSVLLESLANMNCGIFMEVNQGRNYVGSSVVRRDST